MELKTNSWYVWLWEYTYTEDLPNNLCPFFWKFIVAMLLFPINLICRIPTFFYNYIAVCSVERGDGRTGIGIFLYIISFICIVTPIMIYHNILWWINAYSYNCNYASIGGILMFAALIILFFRWCHNNDDKIISVANNNILVNFTKSWYNNHCPQINWKK